ncbi:trp operon repressor [Caedibacter taeniospiralis]|jgi:TrpR family trp operon transcriptional repressor|uniref:trp operon repressor n=1 Tax=Caedibacter taeniospiralis TaxID=28907 RepID=UPI0037BEB148
MIESDWKSLVALLQQTKEKVEMNTLLDFLLTLEEKHQLANRYALAKAMIVAQKPQREIAKDLGVSISTVTRCSNALKLLPNEIKLKFTQQS